MVPRLRNFSALLYLQPLAENKILVVGEIERTVMENCPSLCRIRDNNSENSALKLKIEMRPHEQMDHGSSVFFPVRFEADAQEGEFPYVDIFWNSDLRLRLNVDEIN